MQWRTTAGLPVHRGQIHLLTTIGAKILFLFNHDAARPMRLVLAPFQVPHDNLVVMHLREDFLTLMLSGHRRSVRQLHTIEHRPTIPFRHSSLLICPVPLERSAPLRPATRHFEFFFAATLTSLWRSLLPKLAAIRGSVREASTFSQPAGAKTESQTLLLSDNVEISRQAWRRNRQGRQVTRTLSLGPRPCGCSLGQKSRSIPFFGRIHDVGLGVHCAVLNELSSTSTMLFLSSLQPQS